MSGMEWKVDDAAKPGAICPWEAPAADQADPRVQTVMTQSKVRVEKTEQPPVREEGVVARSIHKCL